MQDYPILILGMHRSGTTMVSNILERYGIFFGHKKDENNESYFFTHLNQWIFHQANASWDNPHNLHFMDDYFKNHITRVLDRQLGGFQRLKYLGWKRYLKYSDIRKLNLPWGWKDPRNVYTLRIWQNLFKGFHIIHIYRNPLDVAHSLRKREIAYRSRFRLTRRRRIKQRILKGKVGYTWSLPVMNLIQGVGIWQEYLTEALKLKDSGNRQVLHIKYEDFLSHPESWISKMLGFLRIPLDETINREVLAGIDTSRKYAFLANPELLKIYKKIKERGIMANLGYDRLI